MKRFVLALTLIATTLMGLQPALAGDRYSSYVYPVQSQPDYPPASQEGHPILKKLIIGGVLVGVGFAAGRLTAPRPQPYYGGYPCAPHHGHRQRQF